MKDQHKHVSSYGLMRKQYEDMKKQRDELIDDLVLLRKQRDELADLFIRHINYKLSVTHSSKYIALRHEIDRILKGER